MIKRGSVVFLKEGSAPRTACPYVVVSNDKGNQYSGSILIVPINGYEKRADLPTHAYTGHNNDVAMCEHIMSVDVEAIDRMVDVLSDMTAIDRSLAVTLGLSAYNGNESA